MTTPLRRILNDIALVCPHPSAPKEQRRAELVTAINAATDPRERAALAARLCAVINEPEPLPAAKTPEELVRQRIQDERDYFQFIANRHEIPLREKAETA